jgi:hypothetical protein
MDIEQGSEKEGEEGGDERIKRMETFETISI